MKMLYETDANLDALKGQKIVVLGYGSQGHSQSQNLRDSGMDVTVALRKGSKNWTQAEADGMKVATLEDACQNADVFMILVPDEKHQEIYETFVLPNLKPGKSLMFSHGFSITYGLINPPEGVDVFMIAPKAPGHMVRRMYVEGKGVPALVAVERDATGKAWDKALAYGKAIGSTKAGVLVTTFREETETDLFGEQAVLCGGVSELIKAGFETLVNAGYQPEVAYFECLHEVKLIVDMINEGGLSWMRFSVSDTAEYGDLTRGPRVINDDTRAEMKKILKEIQDGIFAKEWLLENRIGRPVFNSLQRQNQAHQIETVGKELRSHMEWLKK